MAIRPRRLARFRRLPGRHHLEPALRLHRLMAVYQGARQRVPLPLGLDGLARDGRGTRGRGERTPVARPATKRSHTGSARRPARALVSRARPSTIGIALGAVVLVVSAAVLSLSQ